MRLRQLLEVSGAAIEDLMHMLSPTDRIHFSKKPITNLKFKDDQSIDGTDYLEPKPEGLWYGFGGEWLEFADSYEWANKYKYLYEIETNEMNVLSLSSEEEINEFGRDFGVSRRIRDFYWDKPQFGGLDAPPLTQDLWRKLRKNMSGDEEIYAIWWNSVPWDGVEITIEPPRYGWTYAWDVKSGVIFRKGGIKNIKLILGPEDMEHKSPHTWSDEDYENLNKKLDG